jgi:hypothetical protein
MLFCHRHCLTTVPQSQLNDTKLGKRFNDLQTCPSFFGGDVDEDESSKLIKKVHSSGSSVCCWQCSVLSDIIELVELAAKLGEDWHFLPEEKVERETSQSSDSSKFVTIQ